MLPYIIFHNIYLIKNVIKNIKNIINYTMRYNSDTIYTQILLKLIDNTFLYFYNIF